MGIHDFERGKSKNPFTEGPNADAWEKGFAEASKKAKAAKAKKEKAEKPEPRGPLGDNQTAVETLSAQAAKDGITDEELEQWAKARQMDPTKESDAKRILNGWKSVKGMIKPSDNNDQVLF